MNDITFTILKAVVSVCAFLITVYAIPYLDALKKNEKYKAIISTIEAAVEAAEQTIRGSGRGAEKKQSVMESVSEWLIKHRIDMTASELSELVESAVYGMNAAKGE